MELSQRHNSKSSELTAAVFIAEQNLYLLWLHLDFYFRNAVIYAQENRNAINESCMGKQRSRDGAIYELFHQFLFLFLPTDPNNMSVLNASQDEITELKQMLISTFNETFCAQLIRASEEYTVKCKNFNAALLRRIKALVQFAPQS